MEHLLPVHRTPSFSRLLEYEWQAELQTQKLIECHQVRSFVNQLIYKLLVLPLHKLILLCLVESAGLAVFIREHLEFYMILRLLSRQHLSHFHLQVVSQIGSALPLMRQAVLQARVLVRPHQQQWNRG